VTANINEFAISAGSIVNSTGNYGGWALWANGYYDRLDFTTQAQGSGTNSQARASITSTIPVVYSATLNGTNGQGAVNGVLGAENTNMITPNNNYAGRRKLRLGCAYTFAPAFFYRGAMKEVIFYTSDQSANRTAFEANIGETYGIDLPSGVDTGYDQVDGFVETWYDQSGNGNDATQDVAGSQPKIVDAGVLVEDSNGNAQISFLAGAVFLGFTPVSFTNESIFVKSSTRLSNAFSTVISGADNRAVISQTSSGVSYNVAAGGFASILAAHISGNQVFTFMRDGTNVSAFQNGNAKGTSTSYANVPIQRSIIGKRGDTEGSYPGGIGELILYPSDQSANRPAIEANINNQYDIY
jgi:hypothetical protein